MCKKSIFIYLTLFALVSCLVMADTAKAEAVLLARWKLDGNALDSSGNDYHGTPTNVEWLDDPVRGLVASFNGVDAYIATPIVMGSFPLERDFSWTFWYKYDPSSGRNDVIVGNRGGGDEGLQFIKFTPSQFEFYSDGANSNIDYDDYQAGEWTHCSMVKLGASLTYYRNGVVETSVEVTNTIDDANNPFWIGGDPVGAGWGGELSAGQMSDVRLYDSALNEQEVQYAMIPPGPIPDFAWYKLDGNALDSTENEFHGEPTNVEWVDDAERGMVASFNGVDAYITTPIIMGSFPLERDFTWSFWYKYDPSSGRNDVIIGNRGGGDEGLQFIKFTPSQFEFYSDGANSNIDYDDYQPGEWTHCTMVKAGASLTYYRNGLLETSVEVTNTIDDANNPFWIGGDPVGAGWGGELSAGQMSDVRLYNRALSPEEALELKTDTEPKSSPFATSPNPGDRAEGVPVITNLTWKPGTNSTMHDVYFGSDEDAVRYATTDDDPDGVYLGQIGNPAEPPILFPVDGMLELEYDTDYYWRIDESSDADPNILVGTVWKFTTELYGAVMPAGSITATASSSSSGQGPANTLGDSGTWLSRSDIMTTPDEYIQYEFDQVYTIAGMYIMNYDSGFLGYNSLWRLYGIKDAAIEYSVDGENWESMSVEIDIAPATTRVKLVDAPITAKYVRIVALSNYGGGGFFNQYGLSEVRFFTK